IAAAAQTAARIGAANSIASSVGGNSDGSHREDSTSDCCDSILGEESSSDESTVSDGELDAAWECRDSDTVSHGTADTDRHSPKQQQTITHRLTVGEWNIHGLSDYKQQQLLHTLADAKLDVIAIVETHLANAEELQHW